MKLAGVDLAELGPYAVAVLIGWLDRMKACGQRATLLKCPDHDHFGTVLECCKVPACPHEEKRKAKKWTERGRVLMELLPNYIDWRELRRKLIRLRVKLPKLEPDLGARMSWKLLTIATRKPGSVVDDLKNQIKLRRRLLRLLKRRFGVVAAFAAIELGKEGNAHLHLLVYSPFLPQYEIKHWLQSQDCEIEGCKHKAGDRSCGGSWGVDIRTAYDPAEALKYACSPDPKGTEEYLFEERRLLVYLVLYKRHRIETYGLAKPGAWKLADLAEYVVEHNVCPYCGQPMVTVQFGVLDVFRFRWRPAGRHSSRRVRPFDTS